MFASQLRVFAVITGVAIACALPGVPGSLETWASPPSAGSAAPFNPNKPNLSEQALRLLQEGNERFLAGKPLHPNTDVFRIGETGEHGQHPFATIVACADSRVAVERLFDRGVGDLFVVRVAGAIGGPNQSGSVEYACEHLGTQLVVIMGHTKCGAVKAAIAGGNAGRNIGSLLECIAPAVQTTRDKHPDLNGEELNDAVVRENVWTTIEDMLRGSAMMREFVSDGRVRIVGAVYNIETGRVEWMGTHPALAGLLKSADAPEAAKTETETKPEAKATEKPAAAKPTGEKPAPTAAKPSSVKPTPSAQKPAESKPADHEQSHAPSHASTPH